MHATHIRCVLLLVLGCTASAGTFAVEPDAAGIIKTLRGSVSISRFGQRVPAAIGGEVFSTDAIVTGPGSSVGITLRDNTLLAEGASSTLELNQFIFDSQSRHGALEATVKRGSLAVIDGQLAKTDPAAVQYRTPTTTLGVRGTEFIIEVGQSGEVSP